jgi:hypothetical protein
VVAVILAVLAGNVLYVAGLTMNNPITWTAGISHFLCHISCGRPAIDPNLGFITQPLGHQAALDLLHGHWPWWNYFEGLGQPLAGEMQSAALFPLTLLFGLGAGLLWFHVALEIIAGLSTYFLARRLSIPTVAAVAVGAVFALNGTYAWLGNAVLNPVAFLPMLLLGVEMIIESAASSTNRGWYVAALALALSLYAGFPEVAYFDGLFAGLFALVRLASVHPGQRARALRRLGLGGGVGVALALPALVPFYDFLKVADVGAHASAGTDSVVHLPISALPMYFDPYVYGTIFFNPNVNLPWGNIGGYFTITVTTLALVGLVGARHRALRVAMGLWTLAGLAGTFNVAHTRQLWNVIPLVANASFPRYVTPSCEMAMVLLAGLGLWDLTSVTSARRRLTIASAVALLILLWSVHEASPLNKGITMSHKAHVVFLLLGLVPFGCVLVYAVLSRLGRFRWLPVALALLVVGESLVMYVVPTGEAPKQITVDQAPITYLQSHEGEYRFVDFGVIFPNWGTQYHLNSLSAIDLPFPRAYKDFIERTLYPGLTPGNQFVVKNGITGINEMQAMVAAHLRAFEDASAKYLIMPSSVPLNAQLAREGVTQVFADAIATIYLLPHPRAFFSAGNACVVTSTDPATATTNCPHATSVTRTELAMKGWTASVNGRSVPITTINGVYQRVDVPAGAASVRFSFRPPHELLAFAVFVLALAFIALSLYDERRALLRPRRRATRALPRHRA